MIWDLGSRVWGSGFRISWLEVPKKKLSEPGTLNPMPLGFKCLGVLYRSEYCGGPKVRPTLNYKQKW